MNRVSLYDAGKLIFLQAITPVHVGVGRVYGEAVDLPVQRDEFGFPVIWGSSLKGVLRAQKELSISNSSKRRLLKAVFGPDESEESRGIETASSMSVLDARLVLVPARSLKGLYIYVTSRHLLQYYLNYVEIILSCTSSFTKDLREVESNLSKLVDACDVSESRAVAISDSYVIDVNRSRKIVINEQILDVDVRPELANYFEKCFTINGKFLSKNEIYRIIVVSDRDIDDIVRRSLQVITRVKIDREKKTVRTGALWSEEYVPSSTVFVGAILYSMPRILRLCISGASDRSTDGNVRQICEILKDYDVSKIWSEIISPGDYLILGGHETIGKGIMRVTSI
ncbi:MAG: type III-B CRISPR module RAMP protein Cmr4 [Crenarchaeota archaeon]|nr:type III-B CRISPR module RAMP protein Cmr4 [Thermoproteota archaeon]